MDKLLQPDTGLMIWTAVTFLLLVLVLTKAAWKPILDGINQRESRIRTDLERAERSQAEAEALRQKYEQQLAEVQKTITDLVLQARRDGEKTRAELVAIAKQESERILEKGRKDLAGEAERLKVELRGEVADLSLAMTEKILNKVLDKKMQDEVLQESMRSIAEVKR